MSNHRIFTAIWPLACCLLLTSPALPVFGAAPETGQEQSRQSLRSRANPGGPEDWPENQGLSTSTSQSDATPPAFASPGASQQAQLTQDSTEAGDTAPAPVASAPKPAETTVPQGGSNVSGTSASGNVGLPLGKTEIEPEPETPREVIYVDENGNPVPKPPEPDRMFAEATKLMEEGKYDDALALLRQIHELPNLPQELQEKTLYGISDCLWARYAGNPLAGYEPIVTATHEAMNANLRSPRVPDALLRLGLANINVNNLAEASGFIVALMRRFPDFPGVAQGLTALGNAQLKNGKFADAEHSFGIVLDRYPESSQLQDASVGLSRALVHQNKDERAQVILDFISKRWPRYYINDPDFLLEQAANDERLNRKKEAMDLNWLYVNLDPKRPENAPLLLKMGDEYMQSGNRDAADFIYEGIERDFPDSPAAVTSRLRLAEGGIYDTPINYEEMSRMFARGAPQPLWKVYNELADASSVVPESVLARLKQAMWLLWNKEYPEAMGKSSDFIDAYPEHPDIPQAREVLWDAFQKELAQSLNENNYGRILLLWNGFPYVRERYGKIDAPLRYALSQGWLERGDEQKSFELLSEFLKDPMDAEYGEAAFSQFFNYYLQNGNWDKILDLGKLVQNWKMKPELQNQLEYALALSAQNLNLGAPALNRWKNLANRTDIPLYQQAYATYFLAKDAENRRDIRNAYEGNRKVIEMFTRLSDERSDKADPQRIKESIASLMDICEVGNRVPEALQWLERYNAFVGDDSPEYPGLRFREARLYRKLGDNARAQALLEDVAKRFPQSPFAQAATAELRTFDVSRDLQRYMTGTPHPDDSHGSGSTSGNWSSSGPTQTSSN